MTVPSSKTYFKFKWIILFMSVQQNTGVKSLKEEVADTDTWKLIKNRDWDESFERSKVKYNTPTVSDLNQFSVEYVQTKIDKEKLKRLKPILAKLNKVLVKRVLPHGYKSPILEHDQSFKTIYRPLFKFHKVRPVIQEETENEFEIDDEINAKINKNTKSDEKLLEPFKLWIPKRYRARKEYDVQKNLLADIKFLLKRIESDSSKKKTIDYQKILKLFDRYDTKGGFLRQKEGDGGASKKKVKKPTYPFYNYWNWWNYHNTVIHDECPPNQFKMDNVCIWED